MFSQDSMCGTELMVVFGDTVLRPTSGPRFFSRKVDPWRLKFRNNNLRRTVCGRVLGGRVFWFKRRANRNLIVVRGKFRSCEKMCGDACDVGAIGEWN